MAANQISFPTYALNEENDIYLDAQGNIAMVDGADAVIQTIQTNIGLWLGEYAFNTSIGVNYPNMLGELPNQPYATDQFNNATIAVPYVAAVNNIAYSFNPQTRTFNTTIIAQISGQAVPNAINT